MFGMSRNPTTAYAQIGVDSAVQTADPHQLILLLFDGAIEAINLAKAGLANGDISGKGAALSKAIGIISNGLQASLDSEAGGELAHQLDALYEYMVQRLLWANLKNDVGALNEVSALLSEIRGAWAEISPPKVEAA
jgi:flagellar protein FliS